jgi:hypothetical protein
MQADSESDWNQGWQDFVIGLALSFAFVEAITAAILIRSDTPAPAIPTPTTQLQLFFRIVSVVMPFVLIYGMYAATGFWLYRAHVRLTEIGRTSAVVYRRIVRSPYHLGSVAIFGSTFIGVILSNLIPSAPTDHGTRIAGALLRAAIGVTCAWIAVYIRRDIDLMWHGDDAPPTDERPPFPPEPIADPSDPMTAV